MQRGSNQDVTEEAPTKHSYLSLSQRSDTDHITTQRVKLQSTTIISTRLRVESKAYFETLITSKGYTGG